MINKKHLIYITILACILVVAIPTIYKVIKNHQTKLYLVVEKEIIEAANKCWDEEKCSDNEITLKTLYDLNYLEKQSDPITKKVYDDDSLIIKNNEKIELKLK